MILTTLKLLKREKNILHDVSLLLMLLFTLSVPDFRQDIVFIR